MADGEAIVNSESAHDIKSLLSSENRDFLLRNNGDQVKVADLNGKTLGLYFSASWCGPCKRFTPTFVEVYKDLSAKGDFEVVFVSADKDEDSFKEYFSKMPWLAIPYSDSASRKKLDEAFQVQGIPHVVLIGVNGKILGDNGVELISEYGVEAYPFTPEKQVELKEAEEAARRNQSLSTLLVTPSRDFLISNDGNKVLVSEIEGKMVGIYFCYSSHRGCKTFTPKLLEIYNKVKDMGENFEVVVISLDEDEQCYSDSMKNIPFLAVPFKDSVCQKLARYFELSMLPTLVIIGPDGKTLNSNVVELIEDHGIHAYPFTSEKLNELAEIEKQRLESQTLESLLVTSQLNYVIGKGSIKVPVSELVGKHILLYFSAHWCPPCRAFMPKLIKAYHEIKEKDPAFEVIFISSDSDQSSFDNFFSKMPWLALPFGDPRKQSLSRTFKILGIPSLIALGPTGKTITKDARDLLTVHGSDAYPFTEEHLKALEAKMEEMAKGWPEKVKYALHPEHELKLQRRRMYGCDGCNEQGHGWSYYCNECDFDAHPKCALGENCEKNEADVSSPQHTNEGWVCDGDVCKKA